MVSAIGAFSATRVCKRLNERSLAEILQDGGRILRRSTPRFRSFIFAPTFGFLAWFWFGCARARVRKPASLASKRWPPASVRLAGSRCHFLIRRLLQILSQRLFFFFLLFDAADVKPLEFAWQQKTFFFVIVAPTCKGENKQRESLRSTSWRRKSEEAGRRPP